MSHCETRNPEDRNKRWLRTQGDTMRKLGDDLGAESAEDVLRIKPTAAHSLRDGDESMRRGKDR